MTEIVEVLQVNKLQRAHIIQGKHSTTNRDSSVSVTQKKTVPRPEQTPWNLTLKQSEKCHIIYCVRERRKFIVCPCRHSVGRVNLSGLLCVCRVAPKKLWSHTQNAYRAIRRRWRNKWRGITYTPFGWWKRDGICATPRRSFALPVY